MHRVPSALATLGLVLSTFAAAQTTQRVSVSSLETEGNGPSRVGSSASLSADGRYAVFYSSAGNLVLNDFNVKDDVFLRDLLAGTTVLVSVAAGVPGSMADGHSFNPAVSADGRYVIFESLATNLVPVDLNGTWDVFVRDREPGTTERVSVATGGFEGNGPSQRPTISDDGRYVVFRSSATNLVAGDTNGADDIFLHDRQTGETRRVSVGPGDLQANGPSDQPVISGDGRHAAFRSRASNLVPSDSYEFDDAFVADLVTGSVELVSVDSDGIQGFGISGDPCLSISTDGRFVAFTTYAALDPGDLGLGRDVYRRDRIAGTTLRVSVASDGGQADAESTYCGISGDGRLVAFSSRASNLTDDPRPDQMDLFARDMAAERTFLVSRGWTGGTSTGHDIEPSVSRDGETVLFTAFGPDLLPDDTNGAWDAYARGPFSEVTGLMHAKLDASTQRLSWESAGVSGPFNVHRGTLDALFFASYDHEPASGGCGVTGPSLDLEDLADGIDAYYLVTLVAPVGEGPFGSDSLGAERPPGATGCP